MNGPKEVFEGRVPFYSYPEDSERQIAYWPGLQLITSIRFGCDSLTLESILLSKNGAQRFASTIHETFHEVTPQSFKNGFDVYSELWNRRTSEWKLVELLDEGYFVTLNLSPKVPLSRRKSFNRILHDRFGLTLSMDLVKGSAGITLYFPVTKEDSDFLTATLSNLGGKVHTSKVNRGQNLILGPNNSIVDFLHFGPKSKSIIRRMRVADRPVYRYTSEQLRTMILDQKKPWLAPDAHA